MRAPRITIAIAAVLAVIAVIAAIGGFSDVPDEKLPVVAVDEPYPGNEITTTVSRVYLTPTRPAAPGVTDPLEADEGKQFLIVDATITNTTTAPSYVYDDILRVLIDGVIEPTVEPEAILDERSARPLGLLQPGLQLDAAYLWQVDLDGVAAGDDIIIGILDRVAVANDPVFGDSAFTRPAPAARILTSIGTP